MAADEYYDAIGQVLSYVLSAEDFIVGQRSISTGKYFVINRDNTHLDLYADPRNRYFTLIYQFSLTDVIAGAYDDENQLLRGDMTKYNIDDSELRDENLHHNVAIKRLEDVEREEKENLIEEIVSVSIHSDCRLDNLTVPNPWSEEPDEEIWDGVMVIGLLYPYDKFTPRDYEQVAQEVISVGNQIDRAMQKLDVMEEIGFESI